MDFDFKTSNQQALDLLEKLKNNPRDIKAFKALAENMKEYTKNINSIEIKSIKTDIPKSEFYGILQKVDGIYHITNGDKLYLDKEDLENHMTKIKEYWKEQIVLDPNAEWLKSVCEPIGVKIIIGSI